MENNRWSARNTFMTTKNVHFSSDRHDWRTPKAIYEPLNQIFKFTLDPCATPENALCKSFFTQKENGLIQSWDSQRVFMNPPYGREIGDWVAKASQIKHGVVVCLLPARTDTKWWHDYVMSANAVLFVKGRVSFLGAPSSAPFPSVIVLFSDQHSFSLHIDSWEFKKEPILSDRFIANYGPQGRKI